MRIVRVLVALGFVLAASPAFAVPFDFTSGLAVDFNAVNPGGATAINGGVTGTGFADYGAGYVAANLWLRNSGGDHGLGVCNTNEAAIGCLPQGGDYNELSNNVKPEVIVLDKGVDPASRWTSLWVSSLDNNGGAPAVETGRVYWSNTNNIATALASAAFFSFANGDFGNPVTNVEGNLLTLAAAAAFNGGAGATSRYLFFVPGPAGTDNDYLVWKGDVTAVPEPTSLLLLGTGLLAARRGITRARAKK